MVATNIPQVKMYELVKVGDEKLIGEVIKVEGENVFIQVYEETSGIGPGEPVFLTGSPLTVELGPGLLSTIYDGVERPLEVLFREKGAFIARGITARALPEQKKWLFIPLKKEGDEISGGDILGQVPETPLISHKILVPPMIGKSKIISIVKEGQYTINEEIAEIKMDEPLTSSQVRGKQKQTLTLSHQWPVRKPRPVKEKLMPKEALITGQRVLDTLFPLAKGGAGCVPGPFGAGKTIIAHQLAKWADAEIIISVGCGERGNEITELLIEFPELKEPESGRPLMERTVIIANTSNMPVAAREASVYTGMTIAEYFRDMGYSVALMADSTSRWAEALREISGRLEEMPGDEAYPAYLGSRTAAFYERAGLVKCLGKEDRKGSLTVIGAVSPPGGDLSEPVTQNTLRVTKVFWALDSALAYRRHFPAINWLNSYSLYKKDLTEFFNKKGGEHFNNYKEKIMTILQKEAELTEIVRLVGLEALSLRDQFLLEVARIIREDFLHQNAFDEIDSYTSLKKQYLMLKTIIAFYENGSKLISDGKELKDILKPEIKEKIAKMKFVKEENLEQFELLLREIGNY